MTGHIGSIVGRAMLEVTSLGSGSSGNALLLRTTETILLVDCGIGIRRLTQALRAMELDVADIDAVLISHEHSDHVQELPRLLAQGTPVVCTAGSARAANIMAANWMNVSENRVIRFGGAEVSAIPVSHDAMEPCGFLIETKEGAVSVLTDLGCPSPRASEAIARSHLVVVEANHDEALLRRGPYPRHLQRRILSSSGHLSNDDCGELLATALRRPTQLPTVWLAHLSETNNRPHIARNAVARRMARSGLRLSVLTLPRREVSETWRPGFAPAGSVQLTFDL